MKKILTAILVFAMIFSLSACGTVAYIVDQTKETTKVESVQAAEPSGNLRPEFKEAMDAYEEFYQDYVDFMKKYKENPSDLTLLANYASMMSDAAEMEEKFSAWDQGEMNADELQYYMEVSSRVLKLLAEVTQ